MNMTSGVAGIKQNILECIGHTPMVKINRVGSEFNCELLAKVEYMNPGGSIKDRIAHRMITRAENEGRIKPGDTLIEPTSGNTGVGLALAGAVLGYNVIIVMPEKMSREKQVVIEALGAQIIRTPTTAPHASPESNFGVADRLVKHLPNAHILGQFENEENPITHSEATAEEILEQTGGKIDYLVAGAGTGGTLTGCGWKLKQAVPTCKIIGVDPVGSLLGGGTESAPYQVEGIGYDFFPVTLEQDQIDEWVKVGDEEAFQVAIRLMREEGLLIGGSCGSAMAGALRIAERCQNGERIVVILPDSIRNYMSKFVDATWMTDHGFRPAPVRQFVDWEAVRNHV